MADSSFIQSLQARGAIPPEIQQEIAPVRGSGVHESGMLEPGNIDLNTRPRVQNPEGGYSTVLSFSYRNNAGQEVLIPRVSDEGKIMSTQEAKQYWGQKGQHLGKFSSPSQADAYAIWLHQQQAKQYGGLDAQQVQSPAEPYARSGP